MQDENFVQEEPTSSKLGQFKNNKNVCMKWPILWM
jgi:hypothetical protein